MVLGRPGQGNFWGGWFEFVGRLFLLGKRSGHEKYTVRPSITYNSNNFNFYAASVN